MKIAIVTPGGFDRSGTVRVIPVFLHLVERLARRHEVHVFTLNQTREDEVYSLLGATIHNIGDGSGGKNGAMRAMQAMSQENGGRRFGVVHGLWAGASGLIAALAGRAWHTPSVVTVCGGEMTALPEIEYGGQMTARGRLTVRLTLQLASSVTCASETLCRSLKTRGIAARHIVMGVDTAQFQPPVPPPSGPPRLLHVASLNRVKDQPTLLYAFRRILSEEPAARLDIIGVDTLNGAMQRLAATLCLGDAVAFHGFQPSEVVAQAMRNVHLLLHSSLSEVGPVTLLEAAACGVPTVGTRVGMIGDLAPEAAVAVPVGDDRALARAALELLRDTPARQALGQRALAFARRYDADWTAAQFDSLYRDLVDRSPQRAGCPARAKGS